MITPYIYQVENRKKERKKGKEKNEKKECREKKREIVVKRHLNLLKMLYI